jgi:hypothetical protein
LIPDIFALAANSLTIKRPEDRRAYKRILYDIFEFYAAPGIYLAGAAIAGISIQKAGHFVVARGNQNGCPSARPSSNELSTSSRQRS